MSALPNGWAFSTVGEITLPIVTTTPADTPDTEFKYLDISAIDNQMARITSPKTYLGKDAPSRARQVVAENDTLFSTVRTYLKNIALVPKHLDGEVASTGFAVLRPATFVDPKFLFHYTLTTGFLNPLADLQRGTSYPAVREDDVRSQSFPLPPLAEQRRIVGKVEELFSELDEGVANLKQARAQLAVYRQALLKHAFEGHLTADWRSKHAAELESADELLARITELADDFTPSREDHLSVLPSVPSGWIYTYLSNLGELGRGKSKHRPRNDPALFGGPYPFLQTGEVKAANGTIRSYQQTYSEMGLRQSKLWPTGTLCITIAANIAETAFLGFDACFPDSVVGFTPKEGAVVSEFVELFIRSAKTRIAAYAPATAQKNINLETLENLLVPLPPFDEQKEIVSTLGAQLSVLDALEADIDLNLQKAEALRQSILKKAFAGELVPQDPADEPAAALLARIRAEREAKAAGNPRKKPSRLQKGAS